jgi:hypothetical protein
VRQTGIPASAHGGGGGAFGEAYNWMGQVLVASIWKG